MSQSLARKAPAKGEVRSRARVPSKASGDTNTSKPQQPGENHHHHHRSKNKLPKTVRYDLENALVGLCDVWFEDIKPHLLRNNIKVHVHGSRSNAGHASGSDAGAGDQHGRPPVGALSCSHQDPGAGFDQARRRAVSSAGSCSMRPTASRAQSRKPRPPPFKLLSPLPSPPRALTPPQIRQRNYENKITVPTMLEYPRRTHRVHGTRPPRPGRPLYTLKELCRTNSVSTPLIPNQETFPTMSLNMNITPKTRDVSTQTEEPWPRFMKKPRLRQSASATHKRHNSPDTTATTISNNRHQLISQLCRHLQPSKAQLRKKQSSSTLPSISGSRPPNIIPPLFEDDINDLLDEAQDKNIAKVFKNLKRKRNRLMKLTSMKNVVVKKKPPWK